MNNKKDLGLLLLRVVVGATMFAFHGFPKMAGGPELWEKIGSSMANLGIHFFPTFWGFSAALVETVGAVLVILGLWSRHASLLLAFTMLIATVSHLMSGDGMARASHALELGAVFLAIFFTGPGKYSIDKK